MEKMPRKLKKRLLGKKMPIGKLRLLLKSVVVHKSSNTMYGSPDVYPYLFCPKCGCREYYGTGNKTIYPEHWEYFYCLRCNHTVGYIDNSPFIHALECKHHDYDPVF